MKKLFVLAALCIAPLVIAGCTCEPKKANPCAPVVNCPPPPPMECAPVEPACPPPAEPKCPPPAPVKCPPPAPAKCPPPVAVTCPPADKAPVQQQATPIIAYIQPAQTAQAGQVVQANTVPVVQYYNPYVSTNPNAPVPVIIKTN